MGSAIAGRYLAAGYPTTVWNRTPGRAPQLDELGARRAARGPTRNLRRQDRFLRAGRVGRRGRRRPRRARGARARPGRRAAPRRPPPRAHPRKRPTPPPGV
nr:hypothetical protein [Nocardia brasiliensis]